MNLRYLFTPLLGCLLASITTLRAQTMVDTNKTWNVVQCLNFGACSTINYSFGEDTTIGIHQYKLLNVGNDPGYSFFPEPIALREDTMAKQIFFYSFDGEALIYDFSLDQGDSYAITWHGCNMSIAINSVDSIILLNGESRKRMWVTISSINCFTGSYPEVWIEGIGSSMGITEVAYYGFVTDVYTNLICFHENDTLKYHDTNYSGCYFNTVGIHGPSDPPQFSALSVWPDPASNAIQLLSLDQQFTVQLYDPLGRLMLGPIRCLASDPLDISSLPNGSYLLRALTSTNHLYHARFIKAE